MSTFNNRPSSPNKFKGNLSNIKKGSGVKVYQREEDDEPHSFIAKNIK